MTLERRGFVRREVDEALGLIDTDKAVLRAVADDHPVAGRQRSNQVAVEIVEIQVFDSQSVARPR